MTGRPEQPPYGPYQYHEVLSALRKSIKIDDKEQAIYWANVILTYGETRGPKTLIGQLWIMAAEDCYDPALCVRIGVTYLMTGKVSETDHLFQIVYEMCGATKWWETEDGREVDRLWAKAIGDLKRPDDRREIPVYALDRHTRRGWARLKSGLGMDDRYSGTDLGRQKTTHLFLRDGRLDPDAPPPGPEFWAGWKQRLRLQGGIKPEPGEPTGQALERLIAGEPPPCLDDYDGPTDFEDEMGQTELPVS